MSNAIRTRTLGQFPISIATSLAFEGALGILDQDVGMEGLQEESEHPDRPEDTDKALSDTPLLPVPFLEFDAIYIDLRTLVRNIDGAIGTGSINNSSPMDYYKALFAEIQVIDSVVAKMSPPKKLVFFACSYHSFTSLWRSALFRENTSDRA